MPTVVPRPPTTVPPSPSLVDTARRWTGPVGRVLGRVPPPCRPWVFAVEDTTAQLVWRALGPGPVRVRCADTVVETVAGGGPGAVVLDGLPPDTALTATIDGEGARLPHPRRRRPLPLSWRHLPLRTLPRPPGAELFRFATVSDLHVGERAFGFRGTMVEDPPPDHPHPERAATAAIAELTAWGAQLLLIKGDLTHRGRAEEWDRVGRLLADVAIPVEMLPGNHDHYGRRYGGPDPYEALAHLGHAMRRHVSSRDVPGLRIVMVDSTDTGRNGGAVRHHRAAAVAEVKAGRRPAFVTQHHHPQRLPVPTFWPPGIPSYEAEPFIGALAAVQPALMVSTGHTHRHRLRHVGPVVLTEVGSPKDYPGTWAGYVVHEGGVRQVVRRVARPDVLAWTDYTAGAVLGLWGLWSPGLLAHRCFSHAWPAGW